jgi:hypothetical protein
VIAWSFVTIAIIEHQCRFVISRYYESRSITLLLIRFCQFLFPPYERSKQRVHRIYKYEANCHYGAIRYKVSLEDALSPEGTGKVNRCNCSICTRYGRWQTRDGLHTLYSTSPTTSQASHAKLNLFAPRLPARLPKTRQCRIFGWLRIKAGEALLWIEAQATFVL